MRFSLKVFFSTLIVVVLLFSISGYLLITSMFRNMLDQEVRAALAENHMQRLSLEAAMSASAENTDIPDSFLRQLENSVSQNTSNKAVIHPLENSSIKDLDIFLQVSPGNSAYRMYEKDKRYYMQTVCILQIQDENRYYLESTREITAVFTLRNSQFDTYQQILLMMALVSGVSVFILSVVLTRPIQKLAYVTRRIAKGKFAERVKVRGNDEFGQLAQDFNHMADEVEHRIAELEAMNRSQTDFIASFAHELKTPLTSVIGYADMLRSKKLPPEEHFLAADYIFREGKRLEALSLKLLELIVLKREDFVKKSVPAQYLFSSVAQYMLPLLDEKQIAFCQSAEPGILFVEPDLFKTLLINLLDNARKAVNVNGVIQLMGKKKDSFYYIYINDNGKGISNQDLPRITEAFYRVDKSRARIQGGAGLGLAICSEIVRIHDASITFKSELGKGTMISIQLKEGTP